MDSIIIRALDVADPMATQVSEGATQRYDSIVTKVEQLERDVQALSPQELASFRNWFAEYDWKEWDRRLEADVAAGKLDKLAAEALAELERGDDGPLSHKASPTTPS